MEDFIFSLKIDNLAPHNILKRFYIGWEFRNGNSLELDATPKKV
jgi:hypothetical protein